MGVDGRVTAFCVDNNDYVDFSMLLTICSASMRETHVRMMTMLRIDEIRMYGETRQVSWEDGRSPEGINGLNAMTEGVTHEGQSCVRGEDPER